MQPFALSRRDQAVTLGLVGLASLALLSQAQHLEPVLTRPVGALLGRPAAPTPVAAPAPAQPQSLPVPPAAVAAAPAAPRPAGGGERLTGGSVEGHPSRPEAAAHANPLRPVPDTPGFSVAPKVLAPSAEPSPSPPPAPMPAPAPEPRTGPEPGTPVQVTTKSASVPPRPSPPEADPASQARSGSQPGTVLPGGRQAPALDMGLDAAMVRALVEADVAVVVAERGDGTSLAALDRESVTPVDAALADRVSERYLRLDPSLEAGWRLRLAAQRAGRDEADLRFVLRFTRAFEATVVAAQMQALASRSIDLAQTHRQGGRVSTQGHVELRPGPPTFKVDRVLVIPAATAAR